MRLRRRLVRQLSSPDETTRWEATKALSQGLDKRTLRGVVAVLDGDGEPEARAAAAYVLGFSGTTDEANVLARHLADDDESPVVRAYAAEALGHLLPDSTVIAEVRTAIAAGLRDPEPEVRFWCAFAAGALDLQESRTQLERLTVDGARVEGWWSVSEEAEWALRCLDGEEGPPLPPYR